MFWLDFVWGNHVTKLPNLGLSQKSIAFFSLSWALPFRCLDEYNCRNSKRGNPFPFPVFRPQSTIAQSTIVKWLKWRDLFTFEGCQHGGQRKITCVQTKNFTACHATHTWFSWLSHELQFMQSITPYCLLRWEIETLFWGLFLIFGCMKGWHFLS